MNNCTFNNVKFYFDNHSNPTISNSTITTYLTKEKNKGTALHADDGSTPKFQSLLIEDYFNGIKNTDNSNPIISNNNFENNLLGYGVLNESSNIIDARNNYWGHSLGPKHPSNPNGTGRKVSDNVLFDPWLKESNSILVPIRVSYKINDGEWVELENTSIPISGAIGNLHFNQGKIASFITMPSTTDEFVTSNTFIIQDAIMNNDAYITSFESKYFKVDGLHNFNLTAKIEILYKDFDDSDNIKQVDSEIWLADFAYGVDNYNFSNWDNTSDNEFSKMLVDNMGIAAFLSKNAIKLISDWFFEGGQCYGIASTSLIYKNHPEFIPSYKDRTYDLEKNNSNVYNNIVYAHKKQFWSLLTGEWDCLNPSYSKSDKSLDELNKIKKLLGQNKILVASYNKHSTILHTMIRTNWEYKLYEYNNEYRNNAKYEYSPNTRGRFKIENGSIFLNSREKEVFDFNIPDFSLSNSSNKQILALSKIISNETNYSILDSLMSIAEDSLISQNQNMVVFVDKSYTKGDTTLSTSINFNLNPIDCLDYGYYKVYYFNNSDNVSLDIKTKKNSSFSLMGIMTNISNKTENEIKQFYFENIELTSRDSKARINNVFINKPIAQIDDNNDGKFDLEITPSYSGNVPTSENYPPTLINDFPLLSFTKDTLFYDIYLKDYITDEEYNSLTYKVNYDSSVFDIMLSNDSLHIKIINEFSKLKDIKLFVSDGTFETKFSIFSTYNQMTNINNEMASPKIFRVSQNYPNPFNPLTSIEYELPKASDVKVVIFNSLGQKINTLVNKKQTAGKYRAVWNGRGSAGHQVASGVYFYKIQAGSFVKVKKMLLIK